MSFPFRETERHIKLPNLPPICKCCGRFAEASFLSGIQEEIFILILFQSKEPWTLRERSDPIHGSAISKLVYPSDQKVHRSTINQHLSYLAKKLADTGWAVETVGHKGYVPKFYPRAIPGDIILPAVA